MSGDDRVLLRLRLLASVPIDVIYIGQGRDQRPYSHLKLARGRRTRIGILIRG
jgi:hypothetical protein